MLLPLQGRNIAYDLVGPDTAPTVCITHSLASDGGSDPAAGDYTMQALAGDVATVLDALAIPRVHYIGLSIGGMIGQAFAIEHGAKLISAMWCDTLPASPSGAKAAWDECMGIVRKANSLEPIADATMERWFTPNFGDWVRWRNALEETPREGYAACCDAIRDWDFGADLGRIQAPTLVVVGDEDPATPPDDARRIADGIPGAKLVVVSQARHLVNVEQPEAFTAAVLDHLLA